MPIAADIDLAEDSARLPHSEVAAPERLAEPHGGSRLPSLLSSSFRSLYREHFSMVWRTLFRLGVPAGLIEDAVQDVFLVLHRRRREFAGHSSTKTWICGIAVRVAKDYRRTEARHRRRVLGMKQYLKAMLPRATSPAGEVEQREAAVLTARALGEMAAEEREVLVLVELEELSVAETAAALDLTVRTCQRRLRAARSHFEVLLEAAFAGAAPFSNTQVSR